MTQEEINEGNKIIAEWMGYKYYPECKTPTDFYGVPNHKWDELDSDGAWVKGASEEFEKTPCVASEYWEYEREMDDYKQWEDWHYSVKYHTSWDWLMPVVEKIHNIPLTTMTDEWADVITLPIYTKKEEVFENVVAFIKWYNTQSVNP